MLYFPIKSFQMPEWLGGDNWLFFSPIFNIADASITSGVLSILLFQRRFFKDGFVEEKPEPHAEILAEIENLPEEALASNEMVEENMEQAIHDQSLTSEEDANDTPNKPEDEIGRPLL